MITKKGTVSLGKIPSCRLISFPLLFSLLLSVFSGPVASAGAGDLNNPTRYSTGSIGNYVWLDRDRDGRQDLDEKGIKGVVVNLQDNNGNLITSATTDSAGLYLFSGLDTDLAGKLYEVIFKLPTGYKFSPKAGVISDPSMNSDADEITGKTGFFTLLPGQINMDIDAGLVSLDNGTLPLHTLNLTAQLQDSKVTLKWVAENEMNTRQFFIQRSLDGINYTDIGTKIVTGQINTPTEYTFFNDIQNMVVTSVVYYRIKAEDNIQRFAYSNIAPVRLTKLTGIHVWPIPFASEITVSYYGIANGKVDVQITDNSGKIARTWVFDVNRGVNQLSMNGMGSLPKGQYYVSITERSTNRNFVQQIAK